MIRSLYAGVSGLSNHQIKMDVIGNNIANVNTYGYKQARVTFAETLAQSEGSSFSPHDRFGGVNPMQVGLGMKVSSIDNNFSQGNLQSTGVITDLAIQGEGFFVLSDGLRSYYTRAGGLQIDSEGNIVSQGGSYFVQGKMANENGEIQSGTAIENLVLPFGQKEPANATTNIDYFCNLNSDSDPLAQVWMADEGYETYAALATSEDLSSGLNIQAGVNDQMDIAFDTQDAVTITVTAGNYANPEDLAAAINTAIANSVGGGVFAEYDSEIQAIRFRTLAHGPGHSITITETAGSTLLNNLGISSGSIGTSEVTMNTLLNDLYLDDNKNALVSVGGEPDTIEITGAEPDGTTVTENFVYSTGDTLQDLLDAINSSFAGANATINEDGKIILTDNFAGESQTNINLNASQGVFHAQVFDEFVAGRDAGIHSTTINVYDSLGNAHTVEMVFAKSEEENAWTWETNIDSGTIVPSNGGSGTITFNNDGSLASFSGGPLIFNPGGANTMTVDLNPGSPGSYAGITQFDSPSTTIAVSQDGYPMGNLEQIAIGVDGLITGNFSNGVVKTLGQIAIADFTNPAGLDKAGNNLYTESSNSGNAVVGLAQTNFNSTINSGYLEMSNVDLTSEFTELIVAQRGFQANARVIQTSDMVLSEINGLKR